MGLVRWCRPRSEEQSNQGLHSLQFSLHQKIQNGSFVKRKYGASCKNFGCENLGLLQNVCTVFRTLYLCVLQSNAAVTQK